MSPEIQKILNDIYEADPSLRAREKEILAIVEDLIRLRPDTKLDDNFRARLRAEIMKRAAELDSRAKVVAPGSWMVWAQRFGFAVAGAAICALLILPFAYRQGLWSGLRGLLAGPPAPGAASIEKMKDNAFGTLALGSAGQGAEKFAENLAAPASAPAAAGETAAYSAPAATAARGLAVSDGQALAIGAGTSAGGAGVNGSAGKAVSGIAVPPIYEGYNYRFKYAGDPLPSLESKMDVLRRNKNAGAPLLGSLLSGLNFNLINLSKFSNATLQNLNFVTGGDPSYSVSVNFTDGSVSVSQNWADGGIVYAEKMAVACVSADASGGCLPQPVKPIEMPADDKIIAVADKFLNDFGISRSNYGQPFVQDEWRTVYPMAADEAKTNISAPDFRYVPETTSVMYPLKVNGREVYDESGNKTGMTVSVNVREMTGTSIWNLYSQNYQSSAYDTEQDKERLVEIAEDGGFRQYWYDYYANSRRLKTVELGTPTLAYVKMWIYGETGGEELLVPAYIFPITKKPDNIYQKSVVVPVIKNILDQENGSPMPVPLRGEVQSVETITPPAQMK